MSYTRVLSRHGYIVICLNYVHYVWRWRGRRIYVPSVEICYTYLNRIAPKCVHILADS